MQYMVCQSQNGVLSLDQLRWSASWVSGAFCVASYVHGHHSVWVTDAWRVLQAICQGEIYTNMTILICDICHYCFHTVFPTVWQDSSSPCIHEWLPRNGEATVAVSC